jgi:hypothetical protein
VIRSLIIGGFGFVIVSGLGFAASLGRSAAGAGAASVALVLLCGLAWFLIHERRAIRGLAGDSLPWRVQIEGPRLLLYHDGIAYAEVQLADVAALGEAKVNRLGQPDRFAAAAATVSLKQPMRDGSNHFYIFPDVRGYADVVAELRSGLPRGTECEPTNRWALSASGVAGVCGSLFLLAGTAFMLLVAILGILGYSPWSGPPSTPPAFLWVVLAWCVLTIPVLLWKFGHTATAVSFHSAGFEVRQALIWRRQVRREDLLSVVSLLAHRGEPPWGAPEIHRVKFRGSYFDMSPERFDRYPELVARLKSLVQSMELL